MAEMFTQEELQELQDRSNELASANDADASLRTGLQLLAEAAANLIPKIGAVEREQS